MARNGSYLTKIVLSFALPSLLGVILVAAFLDNKLTDLAIERWGYQHQGFAHQIAESIDAELSAAKTKLQQVAGFRVDTLKVSSIQGDGKTHQLHR